MLTPLIQESFMSFPGLEPLSMLLKRLFEVKHLCSGEDKHALVVTPYF